MALVIFYACPAAYYKTRNTGTRNAGTTEHHRKTEQRNAEHQRNSWNTMEQWRNTGITAEYRKNGTPQKLEPEDKHGIFHYLQFSLDRKVIRAMDR